jgi:hypothetical protein
MSKYGELERRRYQSITFREVTSGNNTDTIIQPTDPFFSENYPNKEYMNDKLFQSLISLSEIRYLEEDIILVNSERTLWLHDSSDPEASRKPDFLRVHKAFFKPAVNPHGTNITLNYGGVRSAFVNQVLFIYEA